jgi:hypothetical protein
MRRTLARTFMNKLVATANHAFNRNNGISGKP